MIIQLKRRQHNLVSPVSPLTRKDNVRSFLSVSATATNAELVVTTELERAFRHQHRQESQPHSQVLSDAWHMVRYMRGKQMQRIKGDRLDTSKELDDRIPVSSSTAGRQPDDAVQPQHFPVARLVLY